MPVVGAVLHLEFENSLVLGAITTEPRILVGELTGNRLPIVTTTSSSYEDKEIWKVIKDLPGVLHIEIAFADFSDLTLSTKNEVNS
jgi:hypothetical protein